MVRGQEETSTSGRPGGRLRATPSASRIILSLTMEELLAYCEVLDNIDLWLMERTDESTLGGEHNYVFFYLGAPCSRATLPRVGPSQAVFTFHPGAPGSYPPQCHSYFDRVLRVESPISTRPLIGRAVYNLFFENRAGRLDVHVGSESPTSGC